MVSTARQPYVYLLLKVDGNIDDLSGYEQTAAELFKKVYFSGMTRCELGKASLAMEDPESFRPELMRLIAREVESLAKLAGDEALVKISGLEGPVLVRQGDDLNVRLFINYRLGVDARAADIKQPVPVPPRTR